MRGLPSLGVRLQLVNEGITVQVRLGVGVWCCRHGFSELPNGEMELEYFLWRVLVLTSFLAAPYPKAADAGNAISDGLVMVLVMVSERRSASLKLLWMRQGESSSPGSA